MLCLLVAAGSIHGDLLGPYLVRKPTDAQLTMNVQINPELVISRLQNRLEMLSKDKWVIKDAGTLSTSSMYNVSMSALPLLVHSKRISFGRKWFAAIAFSQIVMLISTGNSSTN